MTVYAHINSVPNGSTGRIMLAEHNSLLENGEESYAFWGRRANKDVLNGRQFGTSINFIMDVIETFIDGKSGFHSRFQTYRLIRALDNIRPDIVHLHNLHGYYLNLPILFRWLAKNECKVEWTLHDCWAFTGHCAYFSYVNCNQWKESCCSVEACPQLKTYPPTFAPGSSCNWCWREKRRLFTSLPVDRLKLIVPSNWLANLVSESFLSDYPVEVRYNSIDEKVFKPTLSDFRGRFGIGNRFMILGVASPWSARKGLDVFIRLSHELDPNRYAVVLVGVNEKQKVQAGNRIVSLPKTSDARELAEIYSTADLFLHPGVEETFGLTVAEAQSCGTRVLVMENSACAEIADPSLGTIVPADYDAIKLSIIDISKQQSIS